MSDFYSLPPYQYEHAADLSGEYYRDVSPPTTNALTDISQEDFLTFKTEQLTSISQRHTGKFPTPTTVPLVVSDITATQSLVAALQATMKPKATKPVVIIPGAKKRSKA